MAQCWNLLAGYAGLISVGQQAFVGLGGYALYALIILAGLRSAGVRADQRGDRRGPFSADRVRRLPVCRAPTSRWSPGWWRRCFRLLLAQWKELGGGTGNSLPRTATSNMLGLEQVAALFDVRSAAAREIIIYWAALIVVVVIIAVAYRLLRSRLGLALSAIRDGEVAAESVGVDITRTKFVGLHLCRLRRRDRRRALLPAAGAHLARRRVLGAAVDRLRHLHRRHRRHRHRSRGRSSAPSSSSSCSRRSRASARGTCSILGALAIAVMLIAPKGLWGTFSDATGIHLFPTRRRLLHRRQQGGVTMSTRDFDEHSITDAVVERFAATPDARLKQILTSLVRHAHDFVRDVELTQDEWLAAVMFLTRVGHMSDDKRQEFILLSDTLGISMLVDAINHRQPEGATETTVLGPFYVQDPPVMRARRRHLGWARGHAALRQRQRHRAGRHAAGRRVRRCLAGRRRRVLRRAEGRATIRSCAPASSPMRQGGSRSGRWCRTSIRSPTTDRSATC